MRGQKGPQDLFNMDNNWGNVVIDNVAGPCNIFSGEDHFLLVKTVVPLGFTES